MYDRRNGHQEKVQTMKAKIFYDEIEEKKTLRNMDKVINVFIYTFFG